MFLGSAHHGSAWSEIFGFLKKFAHLNTMLFCAVYEYSSVEKAELSKGYQNPKRKLGVIMHFSEIIKLKFGKKMSYIRCI